MTTIQEVIRAAIPDATQEICEYILWARTPFPFKPLTPQEVYKAASQVQRANKAGTTLCEWCHRLATGDDFMCDNCRSIFAQARDNRRRRPPMIELKARAKGYAAMSKSIRSDMTKRAQRNALRFKLSNPGASYLGRDKEGQLDMIVEKLGKFKPDQQNRIVKGWIRSEKARERLYRDRVIVGKLSRDVHLARMFIKGTPLNKVEDPLYTHDREPALVERVWELVYTARGDVKKPEGYNGTLRQFFSDWWEAGEQPSGTERQSYPEKKPYKGNGGEAINTEAVNDPPGDGARASD